jgi:hypothetical protein
VNGTPRFAVCISNAGYPESLELRKIYKVLPDIAAAKENFMRVIDETGEDYLYPSSKFYPRGTVKAVARSSKNCFLTIEQLSKTFSH